MRPSTQTLPVTVIGAGVIGLWQALTLAKAGHQVTLIERSLENQPFAHAASRFAGAMLAPDCESEAAPRLVRDLGRDAIALWQDAYPDVVRRGSLVLAQPRDRSELTRYAKATKRHSLLDHAGLAALEPELADRYDAGLYFADEAHMSAPDALAFLTRAVKSAGAMITYGADHAQGVAARVDPSRIIIDCRGFAAADTLPGLRGVRGERLIVRCPGVKLTRPVRLLHPRVPLYVVPWTDDTYMIGATVIESSDDGPMTVRSALELLGAAFALHPAFAEAAILDMGAGVRPALPDNIPKVFMHEPSSGATRFSVNGAYRHGFLLAPILARTLRDALAGADDGPLLERT